MKALALFLISLLLVTCVYAASPAISVKSKSKIILQQFGFTFSQGINTTTGETLVIWDENSGELLGALISPNGNLIRNRFVIPGGFYDYGSSNAYNPDTQEYFVAYSPEKSGAILAVRLDRQGKVIGQEIMVLPGSAPKPNDLGDNSFPYLIFNPKTNGYIMIWERTEGIAACLLDQSGKVTSPIVIVKKNPGPNGFYDDQRTFTGRIEDVQWLASGQELLVVFRQRFTDQPAGARFPLDSYHGQSDDWLAVLDPLLKKPAKISKINTSPLGGGDASLAILPHDTACVFYDDNGIVRRRTINSQGKFTGAPVPAFSGSIEMPLHDPKVALSTTSAGTVGLLIATHGTPDGVAPQNIYARVIDDQGRPVGNAKIVDTFLHSTDVGSILFALPRKPSDKLFQFIWMQSRACCGGAPAQILKLKLQVTP